MESADALIQVQKLEKQIRILQKKLQRSEEDRSQLEETTERNESILKGVIQELQESQITLENRSCELETALENLKSLQVKLVESEKMSALGVLVAGIAHEINNPISFIYGNLTHAHNYVQDLLGLIELYQQNYPEPVAVIKQRFATIEFDFIKEDIENLFQSMNSGAERIAEIIKSLRTFSRLDEATCKQVNIHSGIDSTLVILNHRLQATPENKNGIKVIREYEKLPLVECYSSQLNQVFMNILSNAIDALEEANKKRKSEEILANPNTIWIHTHQISENQIMIAIADNGLGVPDTIITRLFDPFFTTKPVGKGTGLGLSITHQIVTALHHGKLDCHSTPGQGTKFIVTIPIKAQ